MDLKSIHQIFTNRILRIPSYQRGYSWVNNHKVDISSADPLKNIKGQLKDLWDDLMNIPDDSWHYTGLLTLVEVKKQEYNWLNNYKQFAIVDGQQRITSILILLNVILEEANKQGVVLGLREGDVEIQYLHIDKQGAKAYIFGYEKDNPSNKFFKKHILKIDDVEDDSEESTYTENLLKARVFFKAVVSLYLKENGKATINTLFDKVTTQLRLNEYILPDELDEHVVFETMNNRGKPLSQLEKLKNRLLYLTDKFNIKAKVGDSEEASESEIIAAFKANKKQLGEEINTAWITIYKSLGQNKDHPLNDEDFIKNHWIVYFNAYSRNEANVYANFLFDQYFNLQRVYDNELKIEDIRNYVKSLQKSSIWWSQLHHLQYINEKNSSIKDALMGVHQVGMKSSFKPLLLAILVSEDRNQFIEAIKSLEKYSFKIFDLSSKRSNTGDSKIYALAHQVYIGSKQGTNTKQAIVEYTSWYYQFNLFVNQSYELFETGGRGGFYKWSGRFYLLYQYDSYLRAKNRTSTQSNSLNWSDFTQKNSIEHIYPQSAIPSLEEYAAQKGKQAQDVEEAYNKIQLNWSAFSSYSPLQRKRLANSIGNLLAISKSDNASLQNDKFEYKVDQSSKGEEYLKRGYRYDSMSAIIVAGHDDWTPQSILDRGLEILAFLCEYIGEDFQQIDERTKYKVLGLEFMYAEDSEKE